MAESNRIRDLYVFLQSKGYEVYFPGQKTTECVRPYIVIKDEGLTQFMQFSSDIRLYAIMCYMPYNRFTELETMVDAVKEAMKEIFPLFVSTRFETPSFYDDTVKAYMVSIQYRVAKKFYHQ